MSVIGIMQGRLLAPLDDRIQCFPGGKWRDEFDLAREADLHCIEWILEHDGFNHNPITNESGLSQIRDAIRASNVKVLSVCADYFMDEPLVGGSDTETFQSVDVLIFLIEKCAKIGARRIVIPFVDAAAIRWPYDRKKVLSLINHAVRFCESSNVELHLETSLSPSDFSELLNDVKHPLIRVNYDSGNSAALGYDVTEEFKAYGNRIGSVHIKDRKYLGGSVPLGTGDANFGGLFLLLRHIGYSGDYILQVARGLSGQEVSWACKNKEFILSYLETNEKN